MSSILPSFHYGASPSRSIDIETAKLPFAAPLTGHKHLSLGNLEIPNLPRKLHQFREEARSRFLNRGDRCGVFLNHMYFEC